MAQVAPGRVSNSALLNVYSLHILLEYFVVLCCERRVCV
jgi:hypothetical protein